MFSKDILARIRSSARARRESPKIVASAEKGGWLTRLMGNQFWWVHFSYPFDDEDYNRYLECMTDNGNGIIWKLMPDRIAFSDEDDWVMFKVAFS